MTIQPNILPLIFNHVALPPKLPGCSDSEAELEGVERDLTRRLLHAVDAVKKRSDQAFLPALETVEKLLTTCRLVNGDRFVNKASVLAVFEDLQPGHAVILHIVQQNACLFIRKPLDDENAVIFEAFEVSPTAEQTLAAKGALQWDFPGQAVSLPTNEFENPVFQETFATFVEKASSEPINEFAAKTRKAGAEVIETRDTVDPAIITQFLMTLLETNGTRVPIPVLRKRIKDDVCWDDAELPWRRSPFWLVLRVCTQRMLTLRLGAALGRAQYKFLMCTLMAQLLEDCLKQLSPEQCNFLKTKLCRRLAKLETERAGSVVRDAYERLFTAIGPLCQLSITAATTAFESEWKSFKNKFKRNIPLLPSYAEPSDMRLSLKNSISFFQDILRPPQYRQWNQVVIDPANLNRNAQKPSTEQFESLTSQYSALAEIELEFESSQLSKVPKSNKEDCEKLCQNTADRIQNYLHAVADAYQNDPEQMGIFILNIMDLWVHMDKCATAAYPLLTDYHPWLTPELLDVVFLSRLSHLKRLQNIQLYLHDRCIRARGNERTIFTNPSPGCFPDRFFDGNGAANKIHELQDKIENASSKARDAKEAERERVNAEYKSLTEKKTISSCTQRRNPDGTHDIRGCNHCYYLRCRARLRIEVHEDFLPSNHTTDQKRAIVFELAALKAFVAYRDTTWNIIATLSAKVDPGQSAEPEMLLGEYKQLRKYHHNKKGAQGLTLASFTKSYLGTHYKFKRLPIAARHILLPLGLTFSYYDTVRKIWVKDFPQRLTFSHHFAIRLPPNHPFSRLYSSSGFAADSPGPSSYDAVASITECPPDLSVHEYVANQTLMGGKNRRWLSVLTELGSSNINFSLRDTMALFRLLALQAGPRLGDDLLRAVHTVFRDVQFCNRLIEQIEQHMDIISANWREINYMETMLMLTIQLCALGCPASSTRSHQLLLRIRQITLTWITTLRDTMRNAEQVDIAENAGRHFFLSALLCRRTFAPEINENLNLDEENFKCFVQATLAMQEGLVVDLSKFTTTTRNLLVRDIKMTPAIRPTIRQLVIRYPNALGSAINTVWPSGTTRCYTTWQFLPSPYDSWVTCVVQTTEDYCKPQVVHYHLLEGHLLIDGQPMGKLPPDIRDSEILKDLFGNQRLFSLPSNMPGMIYMLVGDKDGHQIHLGYRKQELVIWALKAGKVLEFVPRHVFGNGEDLDLPAALIDNCVHWVDVQSGMLEVRRQPRIWNDNTYWTINIPTRRANRRETLLVDPRSALFQSIATIFKHFEDRRMLTVVQPPSRWTLSVELKRMDLTFHVNNKSLLQCKQLAAEVDPNQDAGTLYGLASMLVLRNAHNRSQRSIITPIGNFRYRRRGMHVEVQIENTGNYAIYTVDGALGRLHSPPEPRLLYTKALLHAVTSCFIPDHLTGRTGTEEALHCLQSGHCQPWTPLTNTHIDILNMISSLTPKREYYPADKRRQQTVHWNQHLTMTIQHDGYQPVIDEIMEKSQRLSLFHIEPVTSSTPPSSTSPNEPHLRDRSLWRRSIYERPGILSGEHALIPPEDAQYISRDGCSTGKRIMNVREIVHLLKQRPQDIHTTKNLAKIMQKWPLIGGYSTKFVPLLLEDCLNVNLSHEWGGLASLGRDSELYKTYDLMFQLGLMAFGNQVDMNAMRAIVAFALIDELKKLDYPLYSSFDEFGVEQKPTLDKISNLALPYCKPFQTRANTGVPKKQGKKGKLIEITIEEIQDTELEKALHHQNCFKDCQTFATVLIDQWPCAEPTMQFELAYLNVDEALEAVLPEWIRLYQNLQLSKHIREVQSILDRHSAPTNVVEISFVPPPTEIIRAECTYDYSIPRLGDNLLRKAGPRLQIYHDIGTKSPATQTGFYKNKRHTAPEVLEIERIVDGIMDPHCQVTLGYGHDLKQSIAAMTTAVGIVDQHPLPEIDFAKEVRPLNDAIFKAREAVNHQRIRITNSLSHGDPRFVWLKQGNLWPCTMNVSLLECLRSTSHCIFGPKMKDALISYGRSLMGLQRLIRMKEALGKKDKAKLSQEQTSRAHVNWDPAKYPDWLLLELDADMQIREEQVTVAMEMISPSSGANSVLQMNMGKGKTSVIMPMVATVLADGKMLNRLLVPKSLLSQTAQILQARLGGLLGREISHIPFSRRTPTTPDLIGEYRKLHEDTLHRSGIILGIPEHVLSFKLSGLQRISDSKISQAMEMVAIQHWMDQVCRDILDECDFTLAVRTQLIYPSGSQLTVDGHPNRWEVTMGVLDLVSRHLPDLAQDFPQSIDVIERTGTDFPMAYFLRVDVELELIRRIIGNICDGQTQILPMRDCTSDEQESIRRFISEVTVDDSVIECISRVFPDTPHLRKNVYLLRGLFVYGILFLCLKKRWNVQYGLHPGRDPIAVPFHAKGVPSDQAEWGHPDVAIIFTCLAFYHQGLNRKQLRQSLQGILRSDDPATEYDRWTHASTTLPEPLRHWNIINVDDEGQMAEIWCHLRFKLVVINHFLRHFVFPVQAKQFTVKLQASGWDIPLYNKGTASVKQDKRPGLTTGFSGTNDNRRLLPRTIEQHDLPGLAHTNAEVLTYLLQERNRHYTQASSLNGKRISELELLAYLKGKKIPILIDAGAFILEMDNQTLAKAWLQEDVDALAAVYFAVDNKPWVQYRTGKTVPLIATPFADNMQGCLVYLDEAHTRGTDLKLPPDARGALTLALNQTKDHTVQAAMRLRQLGTTQSITFIAPPEVHQSILDVCKKRAGYYLNSSHVITWLLHQTCTSNRELQPLYFAQGTDFCHRMQAATTYKKFLTYYEDQKAYMELLQQPEQQTLEQLYVPQQRKDDVGTAALALTGRLNTFMQELQHSQEQSLAIHFAMKTSAMEEVEQEREVAYEVEEERELQRPRHMKVLKFLGLHECILEFVNTGVLRNNGGCMKASLVPESTQLAMKHRMKASSLVSRLYVSHELTRTVTLKKGQKNDNFIRPVNWILWSMKTETAIVIIPEEAEELIPIMRSTADPSVYLIIYAAPFTKRMLQLNRLNYYSMPALPAEWTPPSWLLFELGILAGRLYFELAEYNDLLKHLGLKANDPTTDDCVEDESNEMNNRVKYKQTAVKNQLNFLQEWLALRRHGQDISHTPMGYVCQGRQLRSDHPFFLTKKPGEHAKSVQDSVFHNTTFSSGHDVEDAYYDSDEDDVGVSIDAFDDVGDEENEMS